MAAAYDTYDYPSYWIGREYEHHSELIAIKAFLDKIAKVKVILEAGVGFGRLAPDYVYRAKKTILVDPSAKLLKLAKESLPKDNIQFIQSKIENLPGKIRARSVDLIILVRVLHHLEDPDDAFEVINKLLKSRGYFILEFANKCHFKARCCEFLRGNFTFPLDIFPKDMRSKKNKSVKTLPFLNFHPDIMGKKLKDGGFEIIEKRSVSNIRSPFLKKFFPVSLFLSLEKYLQRPLSLIHFGPSVFILAQKKD